MPLSRLYGINGSLPSLNFLDDSTLLYLCGQVVVLLDLETSEQRFIFPSSKIENSDNLENQSSVVSNTC